MARFIKKHLLLLLSVLLLSVSTGIWYFSVVRGDKNVSSYLSSVKDNLKTELNQAEREFRLISENIKEAEAPGFAVLLDDISHPYFVLKNHSLYFWSTNSFVPASAEYTRPFTVRYVEEKNGKYLVYKNQIQKKSDLYEILIFIPLQKKYPVDNDYINSKVNEDIFSNENVQVTYEPVQPENAIFLESAYLFSIDFASEKSFNTTASWLATALISLAVIFLIGYVLQRLDLLNTQRHLLRRLLILLLCLVTIRGVLLFLKFPFGIIESDIFNVKYFASSIISPSIGDLLLNVLFFTIFSFYLFLTYYRTSLVKKALRLNRSQKRVVSFLLVSALFGAGFLVYYISYNIYINAQWSMDITRSLDFSIFRVLFYVIFILIFTNFLFFVHILSRLFLSLNQHNKWDILFQLAGVTVAISIFFILNDVRFWFLLLVLILFLLGLFYLKLPRLFIKLRYGAYIYFIFVAGCVAVISSYALAKYSKTALVVEKENFARQLLNDVIGEHLLAEASLYIENDPFIKRRLLDPFSSKEIISEKIKRGYLGDYFQQYDIDIHIFDAAGNPYQRTAEFSNYAELASHFRIPKYSTDHRNIYLLKDVGKRGFKRYLVFNDISRNNRLIGRVVVDLKHRRVQPHSVFPELLLDKELMQPSSRRYSYAIYTPDGHLSYSFGNYNFELAFDPSLLEEERIYDEGVFYNSYHHLAEPGDHNVVVISSSGDLLSTFFSNFSFLFLVLIFYILLIVISYTFNIRFRKLDVSFSTKIQIYLNMAFFLPLFIVCIATLSIISSSYRENLNKSFQKKAESLSSNILAQLEKYHKGELRGEKVETNLLELARYTETDINLYDSRGRLLFTNQPMIYEMGLIARFINPHAYSMVHDFRSNIFMLSEEIGDLNYNSVYLPLKSYDTGELLGILSIPFFESKTELEREMIEVLNTIVNIFISIFIIFLIISFFLSKILTVPLKLITQKIRRTTFGGFNEPVEWETRDEIGVLVGEYNKMLVKLEESRHALASSEKESAWREMAKQVAHEIKNPLTPMKLSIQHLQRSLKEKNEDNERTNKSLNLLLDQINNLSEIATSFSEFAKMPVPRNEKIEIVKIAEAAVRLHESRENVKLELDVPKKEIFVIGDEKLMGNIFTNLIINAIQSVPSDREPQVQIKVEEKGSSVLISITDNGTGIPESIREKVFVPNFSTKYSGSGLGLAMAKRGIENAGGKIWFRTIEGEGTTFYIELPLLF